MEIKNNSAGLFDKIISAVFPNRCMCCGEIVSASIFVCAKCAKRMEKIKPPFCTKCANNVHLCQCEKDMIPRNFDFIISPYYYIDGAKDLVYAIKFDNNRTVSKLFAQEICAAVENCFDGTNFDFVCSVPISKKTLRKRSYNQSELIAREFCKLSGKLTDDKFNDVLKKIKETTPQRNLSSKERRRNLRGTFDVDDKYKSAINGATILLIDDVCTTGSTLNECAKTLKLYGAKNIFCATFCKTLFFN